MKIFDLNISNEQLELDLQSYYTSNVKLNTDIAISIQVGSDVLGRRLALVTIPINYEDKIQKPSFIIKETTKHELKMLSIANKIAYKFCPSILRYDIDNSVYIWMENLTTWLDPFLFRVMETLVDNLFDLHNSTFTRVQEISETFDLSCITKESIISNSLKEFDRLSKLVINNQYTYINTIDLDVIKSKLDNTIDQFQKAEFPITLIHGYYVPSSIRTKGEILKVYDWNFSILGYPQLDLVLLIDRIVTLVYYQQLPCYIELLIGRYINQLTDAGINCKHFHTVYTMCYFFRILPLLCSWLSICSNYKDLKRLDSEIVSKVNTMKTF